MDGIGIKPYETVTLVKEVRGFLTFGLDIMYYGEEIEHGVVGGNENHDIPVAMSSSSRADTDSVLAGCFKIFVSVSLQLLGAF